MYLDQIKSLFVVGRRSGFVNKSQVVTLPRMTDDVVLEPIFMPLESLHHQDGRFHHPVQSAVIAVESKNIGRYEIKQNLEKYIQKYLYILPETSTISFNLFGFC